MDNLIPALVDCALAGIRNPKKCLAKLLVLGVDVPEGVTEAEVAALMQSPAFVAAEKKARLNEDYDSGRVRENRAKYRLKLEEVANGDDARTAFAANVKLLAYGGMVEVQKHEVDIATVHEKLLKALAPDGE